jgi:hypothetical protein
MQIKNFVRSTAEIIPCGSTHKYWVVLANHRKRAPTNIQSYDEVPEPKEAKKVKRRSSNYLK